MPGGQRVERREGEHGLSKVEENRLRESLFAEGRQRHGIGEVHGVDAADGEEESALRRAGEVQRSGDWPGDEYERERQQAGSQWHLPGRRREGHAIQRDENRRRQTDGKHEEAQPFRMLFRQDAGEAQQCAGEEQDQESLEGGGHGAESSRKLRAGPVTDQPNRLRTPPGVGTPLQAVGRPGQCHPRRKFCSSGGEGNAQAWKGRGQPGCPPARGTRALRRASFNARNRGSPRPPREEGNGQARKDRMRAVKDSPDSLAQGAVDTARSNDSQPHFSPSRFFNRCPVRIVHLRQRVCSHLFDKKRLDRHLAAWELRV